MFFLFAFNHRHRIDVLTVVNPAPKCFSNNLDEYQCIEIESVCILKKVLVRSSVRAEPVEA